MSTIIRISIFLILIAPLAASKCDDLSVDDDMDNIGLYQLDCSKNVSQSCYCLDGRTGVQFCDPDAGAWSVCACKAACNPSDEVCDGKDNDCNGTVDDNAVDAITWYADRDGDGIGDANDIWESCSAPEHYVSTAGDLNDNCVHCTDPCEEICDDAIDNNCNGLTDSDESCSAL